MVFLGILFITGCSSPDNSSSGGGGGGGDNVTIIDRASGMLMTCQFVNKSSYSDDQVWITAYCQNSTPKYCSIHKDGSLVTATTDGEALKTYSLSELKGSGYQFPTYMNSARLYVTYGTATVPITFANAASTGVTGPSSASSDSAVGYGKYWDFIEFAVVLPAHTDFNVNTSTVDEFGIPIYLKLYNDAMTLVAATGITKSRETVFSLWNARSSSDLPDLFKNLAKDSYKIISPNLISSSVSGDYAYITNIATYRSNLQSYFDSYLTHIWTTYNSSTDSSKYFEFTIGANTYKAYTNGSDTMNCYKNGTSVGTITKPSSSDVWGLATGSLKCVNGETDMNIFKKYLGAVLHRNMIEYGWATSNSSSRPYYTVDGSYKVMNYYSKFWHSISDDGKAYGFSYDDVNGENTTVASTTPRALVVYLY